METDLSLHTIADVAVRVLGVRPVHAGAAPSFLQSSPFVKVKANLLISVDSLSEGA